MVRSGLVSFNSSIHSFGPRCVLESLFCSVWEVGWLEEMQFYNCILVGDCDGEQSTILCVSMKGSVAKMRDQNLVEKNVHCISSMIPDSLSTEVPSFSSIGLFKDILLLHLLAKPFYYFSL